MNESRKRDLLSYEIQAQALRQQAIADLTRAAARALRRTANVLRDGLKPRRPAAPATLPL